MPVATSGKIEIRVTTARMRTDGTTGVVIVLLI